MASELVAFHPRMAAIVATKLAAAGKPKGAACIGLHVRRGDSCGDAYAYWPKTKTRSYPSLAAYVSATVTLAVATGTQCAAAAVSSTRLSDDETAAAALPAAAAAANLTLSMQQINRTQFASTRRVEQRPELVNKQVILEAHTDIVGLASCDALVGPMHSSLDMLVYELIVGRLGYPPPFISMDSPWCERFNMFCPDFIRWGNGSEWHTVHRSARQKSKNRKTTREAQKLAVAPRL